MNMELTIRVINIQPPDLGRFCSDFFFKYWLFVELISITNNKIGNTSNEISKGQALISCGM
jgi:hypothetical protein